MQVQVGIVTISDRASAGDYEDLGGPALREAAQKAGWQVLSEARSDVNAERIRQTIHSFSQQGCGLILTTGGTGVGPRDVTPEAIREIMRVELPGFGEVMRAESMKITANSILSRSLAAIVDLSLVIALPGKAERRCGMSRVGTRRNSSRGRPCTTQTDVVLNARTMRQSGQVSNRINCVP